MDEGMSGFCIKASAAGCGGGNGTGTKCGRWNPTTEQVKVLTELFRSGLRTPSTDQIQKISTQLSFYGKIESKNVFYWFQNHKARERQKRRKVSISVHDDHHNHNHDLHHHHQHKDFIRRMDKISSPKHFLEVNHHHHHHQVYDHHQPEKVMETLQLFPLNSFEEYSEPEKLMIRSMHANHDHHPPLDLRLSFL
ncbi:hypothetical protein EZV62_025787 [Acer yangbiense]|uniref:Homeobox domain-containing protein n=1 Tax=Acer yangbiense TaxID=1000413 RepID=A0A5C7H0B8_9ROSI|nr:hypothetical protein EZV62_025787 [Acer yangbiense]